MLNFPNAPAQYDKAHQDQLQRDLENADKKNVKSPIVLPAPNGSRWKLVVDNSGNLSTVAA